MDKRCSDAHFVPFLFYYYCTYNFPFLWCQNLIQLAYNCGVKYKKEME